MSQYTIFPARVHEGPLMLINAAHPLQNEPAVSSLTALPPQFGEQILLEATTAKMLRQLLLACGGRGRILITSAFRSGAEQERLYASCLRQNGTRYTETYVALPGCSEHQSGLCVDVAEAREQIDPICPDFPDRGVCRTFRAKAALYGFIERYPADKTALTGIGYEPWHFRYVGYPHALIMHKQRLCLEEYLPYLKSFDAAAPYSFAQGDSQVDIFHVPVRPGIPTSLKLPDTCPWQISGNNDDGLVVSVWSRR